MFEMRRELAGGITGRIRIFTTVQDAIRWLDTPDTTGSS